jgi:hypothetical protein
MDEPRQPGGDRHQLDPAGERALDARLRAARPIVDADLLDPRAPVAVALMERAKALAAEHSSAAPPDVTVPRRARGSSRARHPVSPARRRRVAVMAIVAATVGVLAGAGGLLVTGLDVKDGRPVVHGPAPVAAAIEEVAAASEAATAGSGRATLAFERVGGTLDESGRGEVRFAGGDVEVALRYAGPDGAPGAEVLVRSVDGELYLLDGPPGSRRWVHDSGAGSAASGSSADLFRADPRTLLRTLRPEAGFEVVGVEEADGPDGQHGQEVHHLRSTTPGELATLNLGLGPIDARDVEQIDLWVGDDDVVQRLDLVLVAEQEFLELDGDEETYLGPEAPCQGETSVRVTEDDGSVSCRSLDDSRARTEQVTTRYSIRFHDLGTPVTITAPADAIDIEAVG